MMSAEYICSVPGFQVGSGLCPWHGGGARPESFQARQYRHSWYRQASGDSLSDEGKWESSAEKSQGQSDICRIHGGSSGEGRSQAAEWIRGTSGHEWGGGQLQQHAGGAQRPRQGHSAGHYQWTSSTEPSDRGCCPRSGARASCDSWIRSQSQLWDIETVSASVG